MNNAILVLIDELNYADVAIKRAKHIAMTTGRSLHFVAFTYQSMGNPLFGIDKEKQVAIEQSELAKLDDALTSKLKAQLGEMAFSYEVIWHKHPDQWLTNMADVSPYSLIVKARHITDEQAYTALDWRLIRLSPLPLYLAADDTWRKTETVLAAIDLGTSRASKHRLNRIVLDAAFEFSKIKNTDLHACYTVEVSEVLRDLGVVFSDNEVAKAKESLDASHKALLQDYPLKDGLHIKAGLPERVIPSIAADCNAGLLVIGTVGRQGLRGQLLGNTAEDVLKLLKTDVLVVNPDSDDE